MLKNICKGGAMLVVLSLYSCHSARKTGNDEKDGFVMIFDGRSLNNWVGDSTYWRAEDSCLTGTVTKKALIIIFILRSSGYEQI
jgi:hypothetical protein